MSGNRTDIVERLRVGANDEATLTEAYQEIERLRADAQTHLAAWRQASRERADRDALIAEALRIPERHEAHPIFDPVRLHAFLKGREQAWDEFRAILSRAPQGAADRLRAEGAVAAMEKLQAELPMPIHRRVEVALAEYRKAADGAEWIDPKPHLDNGSMERYEHAQSHAHYEPRTREQYNAEEADRG